jgi:hypothetical protein
VATASTSKIVSSEQACPVGIGSPISNEAYDIVSALHAKLEGLEAYRKYAKDANEPLWRQMTEADVQCVQTLCDELERLVREGKFRLREPGRASS